MSSTVGVALGCASSANGLQGLRRSHIPPHRIALPKRLNHVYIVRRYGLSSNTLGLHSSFVPRSTNEALHDNVPESRTFFDHIIPRCDDLTKEVLVLAIPTFFAQAIEPLALLTETAFVGKLGAVQLAAVGVSISAFNYVAKCLNIPLLSVTTSFVAEDAVANALGTKTGKEALPAVSSSIVLACTIGVFEALILILQGERMLSLMGVAADSVMAVPAKQYLMIRAAASPAAVLSLALQGIFRGLKDTKTPLHGIAIASASNIALAPVLMFGLGYGVRGAALAYLAAQSAMMTYLLWSLSKRVTLLPPSLSSLKFDRFLSSGGMLLGRTMALLSVMTFSTSMAARQGPLPMAAHQVCVQLWLATALLSDALSIPVQALLASAFAKQEFTRIKLLTYRILQMAFAMGVGLAIILGTSSTVLSKLFTNDPGVLAIMASIMPFVALTQPINSTAFVLDGILYGASDFKYVSYSTMFNGAVSSALILYTPSFMGLSGVWFGLATVMILRTVTGLSRLLLAGGPWSFLKESRESIAFL